MEQRFMKWEIRTVEEEEKDPVIEGYFAVFNSPYKPFPEYTEIIMPGAFKDALSDDIRALYNHNHDIVLGRTDSNTLELKEDEKGLWGRIVLNRNDIDAMNAYYRIQRGDITGCSIGFDISEHSEEFDSDGNCTFAITKIYPLYEISPCVFPAYEETSVSARSNEHTRIRERQLEMWKKTRKEKLNRCQH